MRFREEKVRLDNLDLNDQTYRITTEICADDLFVSIKSTGLLHPPLLIENKSSYCIVSGFRRISAMKLLCFSNIDAWIIKSPYDKLETIKIAITENALQRPLNIVEKARSLRLLSTCIDDVNDLIQIGKKVGVECNRELLSKLLRVHDLSDHIQKGLINGYIAMPVALMLEKYNPHTINLFADIFFKLRLSLNRQREIISYVNEIALRDDITPDHVINVFLNEVMNDDDLDRNQKTQKLRKLLKQIRFPELSKAEGIFRKNVKKLNFGKGIQLVPPSNFEGTDYMFQLTFTGLKEIYSIQSNLNRIIKDPEFEKMLNK